MYDTHRHQVHALNQTAAFVLRHCDGHKAVPELSELLRTQFDLPAESDFVWLALDQLERARLLKGKVSRRMKAPIPAS